MYILGIHDGHDASAALMKDGRIIAAAQEERFSGLKGDYGYPRLSIDYCLDFAGIGGADIDHITLSAKHLNPAISYIKRNANFSVSHWVKEQELFWKPLKFNNKKVSHYKIFKDEGFTTDEYYDYRGILSGYMTEREMKIFLKRRVSYIAKSLGVSADKITVTKHETNHKSYALFGSRFRNEPVIIITAEGIGEAYNGTVSLYKDGRIETLSEMRENHLAHIYQYVTLMLGMKPNQHEYKVMGLAPYANKYETEKAYRVFKKILKVEGMEVKFDVKPKDLYYSIREALKDCRFDGIAAGAQLLLENILCELARNCVAATGVRKVVMAGGVAQNIKAIKAVSELDCIDDIFVPPAAGDTSNSVGTCYQMAYELAPKTYDAHNAIAPLSTAYLGPKFSAGEIEAAIKQDISGKDFDVRKKADNRMIASLLADGKILGIMRGRMEFGLRALGNRSIIADPSNPMTVDKINQKIKFRDFWMPFTPSILDYRAKDYIKNPKNLYSPYMTMAFNSTEGSKNRGELAAAVHPADKTVRPQILEKAGNPKYYDLIQEFEKITKVGALLNTSFNLHGKPVALGPKESINILLNSGLDGLVLEDRIILRRA
ncbi:MAG: carbamoyltransferase C-terminal domain-containing protein [Candidatus Omnitrophota bacterium]